MQGLFQVQLFLLCVIALCLISIWVCSVGGAKVRLALGSLKIAVPFLVLIIVICLGILAYGQVCEF